MFIQTESTEDAERMRFLPGRAVLAEGQAEFPDAEAAARSPLARRLFTIDGVDSVTLEADAIVVGKDEGIGWHVLKPSILGAVMEHFVAGEAVLSDAAADAISEPPGESDAEPETVAQIKELIETRIHPAIVQSGGDVAFHSMRDGTVYLVLEGAAFGMLAGIENMLRHYVPDVLSVADHRDVLPKPGLETETGRKLKTLFAERINPAVASHGGFIRLVDVQDDTVYIRLEGGCQGCGMANVTLKQGVEVEIMRMVPEVTQVLDVTDHAGGANPYYQPGPGG